MGLCPSSSFHLSQKLSGRQYVLNLLLCPGSGDGSLPMKIVLVLMNKLPGSIEAGWCYYLLYHAAKCGNVLNAWIGQDFVFRSHWKGGSVSTVYTVGSAEGLLLLDFAWKHVPRGPGYAVESFWAELWASFRRICLKSKMKPHV